MNLIKKCNVLHLKFKQYLSTAIYIYNMKHRKKKSLPYQIIYQAMLKDSTIDINKSKYVLHQAIYGVTFDIAIKARCVGRLTH